MHQKMLKKRLLPLKVQDLCTCIDEGEKKRGENPTFPPKNIYYEILTNIDYAKKLQYPHL